MMRWLLVVVAVGASSCASVTPRERVVDGATQIAFGAPLVISGSLSAVGTVGLGVVATSAIVPKAEKGQYTLYTLGFAAGSITEIVVGAALLFEGRSLLEAGLRGDELRAAVKPRASVEDDAAALRRKLQKSHRATEDRDEPDEQRSRPVSPDAPL